MTEEELAFVEEHPVIRLGVDPKFVPFEFINEDGEYAGYLRKLLHRWTKTQAWRKGDGHELCLRKYW